MASIEYTVYTDRFERGFQVISKKEDESIWRQLFTFATQEDAEEVREALELLEENRSEKQKMLLALGKTLNNCWR